MLGSPLSSLYVSYIPGKPLGVSLGNLLDRVYVAPNVTLDNP
jgi:hypothetical protein